MEENKTNSVAVAANEDQGGDSEDASSIENAKEGADALSKEYHQSVSTLEWRFFEGEFLPLFLFTVFFVTTVYFHS